MERRAQVLRRALLPASAQKDRAESVWERFEVTEGQEKAALVPAGSGLCHLPKRRRKKPQPSRRSWRT